GVTLKESQKILPKIPSFFTQKYVLPPVKDMGFGNTGSGELIMTIDGKQAYQRKYTQSLNQLVGQIIQEESDT
ncbi:MAG: hypothetical protein Q7K43_02220, partial [Candidatus Woesearchaeota archaeon]|nr:hypothetical protein [Candidatus Woesearchaeota archaeon]